MESIIVFSLISVLLVVASFMFFRNKKKEMTNVPDETTEIIGNEWKTQSLESTKEFVDNTLKEIKNDAINKEKSKNVVKKVKTTVIEEGKEKSNNKVVTSPKPKIVASPQKAKPKSKTSATKKNKTVKPKN